MNIFIASDHTGVDVRQKILGVLEGLECVYQDLGPFDDAPVDYPLYARAVAREVLITPHSFGILICGSGTGMAIAANKVRGIRAAQCFDEYSAMMARYDNDANILCLRAREFNHDLYPQIIKAFLLTEFSQLERHKRRISKLEK